MARQKHDEVTDEELVTWLEPRMAVERVAKAVGNKPAAVAAIVERLKAGMIRSGADACSTDETAVLREPVLIERHAWPRAKGTATTGDFWQTGDLKVVVDDYGSRWVTYFRVRIDPVGIDELCAPLERLGSNEAPPRMAAEAPAAPAAPAPTLLLPAATAPAKGGRPRYDYWDDLWVEIACRVYRGDIQPTTTQADVERIMMEWAESNGHPMAEATAKRATRKLMQRLRGEDQN